MVLAHPLTKAACCFSFSLLKSTCYEFGKGLSRQKWEGVTDGRLLVAVARQNVNSQLASASRQISGTPSAA